MIASASARFVAALNRSGFAQNDSCRAFAARDASSAANGSGAPTSRRTHVALLAAFALTAFAISAAPAQALPPTVTTPIVSDVSYTTAHVTSEVDPHGEFNAYIFQVSTDGTNWNYNVAGFFSTKETLNANLVGLDDGIKYFVRLVAQNGFIVKEPPEVISPGPNPSFTTLVAGPPSVETTDNATDVEYTTAAVSGKVIRPEKSDDLTCNFEYITNAQFLANQGASQPGFQGATPVACEQNPVKTVGSSSVSAKLTGLTNNTNYHLRLVASTAGGTAAKEAAQTFTTLTVDPPTVVSIENAADVFSRSANVAGMVKRPSNPDPAFDIIGCRFEYVTAAQFGATGFAGAGSAPCVEGIDNAPDAETAVTGALSGLEPATTYHLRLAAENSAAAPGTKEAANTFTTTAKVANPTVVKIDNATVIDQDSAKVSGEVQRPAGVDPALDVSCRFEYVTDASFQGNEEQALRIEATRGAYTLGFKGQSTSPLAFDASPASVQAALEGLSTIGAGNVAVRGGPGNIIAANPYLIVFKGALAGKDVEALTANPGTLETTLISGGQAYVQVSAEGGHAPGFVEPARTDCDPVAPEGTQAVTVNLFGLLPDTIYHLRLTAENGGGTDVKVAASTFTTPANLPADIVIGAITDISYATATVAAEIDTGGARYVAPVVDVSTNGTDWTAAGGGGPGGGSNKLEPVSLPIVGLKGGTKYFVRIRVVDASGCSVNCDIVIAKPPYPSFTTVPVQSGTVLKVNDATDLAPESVRVSGEIERPANPDPAFDTNCRFEYATDAQFQASGYQKALQAPCGIDPLTTPGEKKAVEAELTDLKSGTKYHFRLLATNAGPDAPLEGNTFTTVAVPATVTPNTGASDGEGGYFLSGLVNPRNSTISDCRFVYGPTSAVTPAGYPFAIPCSPTPGEVAKPVTVEGHVTGLNADATYHFRLVATNSFGPAVTADQIFIPTRTKAVACDNEQARKENNSLALPECRAYEMISPPGKEGFGAFFTDNVADVRVRFKSEAGNLANSGANSLTTNFYVADRTKDGWKTIPNLNGPNGSMYDAPINLDPNYLALQPFFYSADLLSSVWPAHMQDGPDLLNPSLRGPDGTFATIVPMELTAAVTMEGTTRAASSDLSHIVYWGNGYSPPIFGTGVYETVGTGNDRPRRVDIDNTGIPISPCVMGYGQGGGANALGDFVSGDGRVIVFSSVGGGCAENPPDRKMWAHIGGTTTVDVSASQCSRADCYSPPCNGAPQTSFCGFETGPQFAGAARDGSRVFFTTVNQLVNGDTDETNDLYACDIPAGTPAPVDKANHCDRLRQVSGGPPSGAEVERVATVSDNGATAVFIAKGVLAGNKGAFGEEAVAGDHNLYTWRTDAAHPDGQTTFVGSLVADDLRIPQATSDGRYLAFTTATQLVPTDTDDARDVYRYEVNADQLIRASTNVFGVAGNADGFDATLSGSTPHNAHPSISEDGQKIVLKSTEALSPVDGNSEPDAYLWTPDRVSIISTGSVGGGIDVRKGNSNGINPVIDGSGQSIYFDTSAALSQDDGDDEFDVYVARVGGGFSFVPTPTCTGETCQPDTAPAPLIKAPGSAQPGTGNPTPPKPCPKGKVRNKKGKCVKKAHKKRQRKSGKKTGRGRGGSK